MVAQIRGWRALQVCAPLAFALISTGNLAFAGDSKPGDTPQTSAVTSLISSGQASVQTLTFKDQPLPIRVVRGMPQPQQPEPPSPEAHPRETEIVMFGPERIRVVRGPSVPPPGTKGDSETITFADPLLAPVTVVRGPSTGVKLSEVDLFGPADIGELDRVAFAVDGIESRHGADLRMWRPEPNGPQGPMQVSAAAALDVGGGDRFDLRQNRLLGRAYLAQMYQRYGNWRDAVAAYNWGPGNLDLWIARGRDPNRLAPGVGYYVSRVLHDALVSTAGL